MFPTSYFLYILNTSLSNPPNITLSNSIVEIFWTLRQQFVVSIYQRHINRTVFPPDLKFLVPELKFAMVLEISWQSCCPRLLSLRFMGLETSLLGPASLFLGLLVLIVVFQSDAVRRQLCLMWWVSRWYWVMDLCWVSTCDWTKESHLVHGGDRLSDIRCWWHVDGVGAMLSRWRRLRLGFMCVLRSYTMLVSRRLGRPPGTTWAHYG